MVELTIPPGVPPLPHGHAARPARPAATSPDDDDWNDCPGAAAFVITTGTAPEASVTSPKWFGCSSLLFATAGKLTWLDDVGRPLSGPRMSPANFSKAFLRMYERYS